MKRKILLTLLLSLILCAIIVMPVFASNASEVGVPEYFENWGGEEYFFANGAAITVEERTDGEQGALVKWKENGVEKSKLLGTVSNIFGGMHDNETPVETSITINGGYVNWIHGGGLHRSNTTTSNIVMNGGQVGMIKGGGADQWIPTSVNCGCTGTDKKWIPGDYENSPCQTEEANIAINGGKIEKISGAEGTVFGGGNGYANTNKANIIISGGNLSNANVIGGGSNGNTTKATITIKGGTVGVVQTVNRGIIDSAAVEVTGGEISKLYIAGEEASDVDGTITGTVKVDITGKADVKEMSAGKNAGAIVDIETSTVVKPENVTIVAGTVKVLNGIVSDDLKLVYEVTVDDKVYIIETGKTIKDISDYNDIIKKDGYEFVGFKWNDKIWNIDEIITDSIKLTSEFKKIETKVEDEEEKEDNEQKEDEEQKDESNVTEDKKEESNITEEEKEEINNNQEEKEEKDNKKDETPKTGFKDTKSTTCIIAFIALAGLVFIRKNKKK